MLSRKASRVIAPVGLIVGLVLLGSVAIELVAGLLLGVAAVELLFGDWFRPYVPPDPKLYDRTLTYPQRLYKPWSTVTYSRDKYALRGLRGAIETVELVTIGGS